MSIYDDNSKGLFAKLENGSGYGSTYDKNTVNPYVNFTKHTNSQTLQDILVAEAIQMRGMVCVYIRRTMDNVDLVFGEDPRSRFTDSYDVAVYIENFDGWEGDQDWMSKFGFMVNDEINFAINPKLFAHQSDGGEPREGDLLYFPMTNSLFELNWVEKEQPFYPLGSLPMRKVKAQKFIYSGEEININTDNYVDSGLDGIFAIDEDDIVPVNDLDKRWDTDTNQGQEVEQIQSEVDKFTESESKYPSPKGPITSKNVTVSLDDFDDDLGDI